VSQIGKKRKKKKVATLNSQKIYSSWVTDTHLGGVNYAQPDALRKHIRIKKVPVETIEELKLRRRRRSSDASPFFTGKFATMALERGIPVEVYEKKTVSLNLRDFQHS